MKKEEAIELLEDLYGAIEDNQGRDYDEAFRMAIEALSADRPQGVGRYENAMQKLREMPKYLNGIKAKQIKKISADRPKVNAELRVDWLKRQYEIVLEENKRLKTDRPSGEWLQEKHKDYKCSLCGVEQWDDTDYCPSCGARMKGGDSE